jgi:hypothetical protein
MQGVAWGPPSFVSRRPIRQTEPPRYQQHHATKDTTTTATAVRIANVSGVTSHSIGTPVSRAMARMSMTCAVPSCIIRSFGGLPTLRRASYAEAQRERRTNGGC